MRVCNARVCVMFTRCLNRRGEYKRQRTSHHHHHHHTINVVQKVFLEHEQLLLEFGGLFKVTVDLLHQATRTAIANYSHYLSLLLVEGPLPALFRCR